MLGSIKYISWSTAAGAVLILIGVLLLYYRYRGLFFWQTKVKGCCSIKTDIEKVLNSDTNQFEEKVTTNITFSYKYGKKNYNSTAYGVSKLEEMFLQSGKVYTLKMSKANHKHIRLPFFSFIRTLGVLPAVIYTLLSLLVDAVTLVMFVGAGIMFIINEWL